MAGNDTQAGFLLLGITDGPRGQSLLFGLFLCIYVVTLVGNIGMMVLVWLVPSLHTPMYFFLAHLSFTDVCNSTVISPRMLTALWAGKKSISFAACVTQFLGFSLFATAECHLLAVMAYDRYVAVCKPLLYLTTFSGRVCWHLVASSYLLAFLSATIYTSCTFGGSFCGAKEIDHFFCDASPVLKLSCSATRGRERVISLLVTLTGAATGTTILVSYICILCTVLRMSSAQGSSRAFKTCLSHLGAVSLYYGTMFFMYLQPVSGHGRKGKVVSIFYTMITPMLNPFIYSLRNKEVQGALGKCSRRIFNHCHHARVVAAPKGTDPLRWERPPSPQVFP